MTTVVCFKVPDGIVLGADSAMTVHHQSHGDNRYDSYHKLSVLCGLPMATAMWGRGAIGQRSVPSLVSEFSATEAAVAAQGEWTSEVLAQALYTFLEARFAASGAPADGPPLNMLVAGYSKGLYHGQVWRFSVPGQPPGLHADTQTLTISWFGVTDAIQTLWWGASPALAQALQDEGVQADVAQRVVRRLRQRAAWGPERLDFTMPLQNAIDLVTFLMTVEIAHERYSPGLARSAPPVDVLVVRPEGVQWVRRKELIAPPTILGGFLP